MFTLSWYVVFSTVSCCATLASSVRPTLAGSKIASSVRPTSAGPKSEIKDKTMNKTMTGYEIEYCAYEMDLIMKKKQQLISEVNKNVIKIVMPPTKKDEQIPKAVKYMFSPREDAQLFQAMGVKERVKEKPNTKLKCSHSFTSYKDEQRSYLPRFRLTARVEAKFLPCIYKHYADKENPNFFKLARTVAMWAVHAVTAKRSQFFVPSREHNQGLMDMFFVIVHDELGGMLKHMTGKRFDELEKHEEKDMKEWEDGLRGRIKNYDSYPLKDDWHMLLTHYEKHATDRVLRKNQLELKNKLLKLIIDTKGDPATHPATLRTPGKRPLFGLFPGLIGDRWLFGKDMMRSNKTEEQIEAWHSELAKVVHETLPIKSLSDIQEAIKGKIGKLAALNITSLSDIQKETGNIEIEFEHIKNFAHNMLTVDKNKERTTFFEQKVTELRNVKVTDECTCLPEDTTQWRWRSQSQLSFEACSF